MRYEYFDTIHTALKKFPHGANAKQIAEVTGKPVVSVSARLSKLYDYDFLERVPVHVGYHRHYRYRVKQHLQAAE